MRKAGQRYTTSVIQLSAQASLNRTLELEQTQRRCTATLDDCASVEPLSAALEVSGSLGSQKQTGLQVLMLCAVTKLVLSKVGKYKI